MRHFLEINQLSLSDMQGLVQRALLFKQKQISYPAFSHKRLANLFYENSTRTRISFELAAQHLCIPVVNFSKESSSEKKGECLEDTVRTLAAMGIDFFVIRHHENGILEALAKSLSSKTGKTDLCLINAGEGTLGHPSQAMLDLMTILEVKPNLGKLKIAIVGNIKHSRVASSLHSLFKMQGVERLHWVAPELWLPPSTHFGKCTTVLREGIEDADVIISLRVQKERLLSEHQIDLSTFHRDYALTETTLAYAKPDAMVMHPGPVNRGVEIDSAVADGPQSYILQQVSNGVYMRMAIIEFLMRSI